MAIAAFYLTVHVLTEQNEELATPDGPGVLLERHQGGRPGPSSPGGGHACAGAGPALGRWRGEAPRGAVSPETCALGLSHRKPAAPTQGRPHTLSRPWARVPGAAQASAPPVLCQGARRGRGGLEGPRGADGRRRAVPPPSGRASLLRVLLGTLGLTGWSSSGEPSRTAPLHPAPSTPAQRRPSGLCRHLPRPKPPYAGAGPPTPLPPGHTP